MPGPEQRKETLSTTLEVVVGPESPILVCPQEEFRRFQEQVRSSSGDKASLYSQALDLASRWLVDLLPDGGRRNLFQAMVDYYRSDAVHRWIHNGSRTQIDEAVVAIAARAALARVVGFETLPLEALFPEAERLVAQASGDSNSSRIRSRFGDLLERAGLFPEESTLGDLWRSDEIPLPSLSHQYLQTQKIFSKVIFQAPPKSAVAVEDDPERQAGRKPNGAKKKFEHVVGAGLIALALSHLAPGLAEAASSPLTHPIALGETLSEIAARYGVTVADLQGANGIVDPNRIYSGRTLVIPDGVSEANPGNPGENSSNNSGNPGSENSTTVVFSQDRDSGASTSEYPVLREGYQVLTHEPTGYGWLTDGNETWWGYVQDFLVNARIAVSKAGQTASQVLKEIGYATVLARPAAAADNPHVGGGVEQSPVSSHVVQTNETLIGIVTKHFQIPGAGWRLVARYNQIPIVVRNGQEVAVITPGQIIKAPSVDEMEKLILQGIERQYEDYYQRLGAATPTATATATPTATPPSWLRLVPSQQERELILTPSPENVIYAADGRSISLLGDWTSGEIEELNIRLEYVRINDPVLYTSLFEYSVFVKGDDDLNGLRMGSCLGRACTATLTDKNETIFMAIPNVEDVVSWGWSEDQANQAFVTTGWHEYGRLLVETNAEASRLFKGVRGSNVSKSTQLACALGWVAADRFEEGIVKTTILNGELKLLGLISQDANPYTDYGIDLSYLRSDPGIQLALEQR